MGLKTVLTTVATAATLGMAKPGVIEVDLIFPRNETYKPDAVFPVVFSVRDPNNAVADLGGMEIGWVMYPDDGSIDFDKLGEEEDPTPPPGYRTGVMKVPSGEHKTAQFLWDSVEGPTSNATKWMFNWSPVSNCTGEETEDDMHDQTTYLWFTTSDKGSAYDIVPKDCKDAQPYVMNITSHAGEEAARGSSDPYCGYANSSLPDATPCDGKISSSKAKDIVKDVRTKACKAKDAVISCDDVSGAGMLAANGLLLAAGAAAWTLFASF